MDSMHIYVGEVLAGELRRDAKGVCFRYEQSYKGAPVFLNWPVDLTIRHWQGVPPELDCLLPETAALDQWQSSNANDDQAWALLSTAGVDLPGAVSVLPRDSSITPAGREATSIRKLSRAKICPQYDALPYDQLTVSNFNACSGYAYSLANRLISASAIYSRKESCFKLVNRSGSYRLTLAPKESSEWVENQVLTARLAHDAGLAVAPVGRVQTADGVPILWSERFDRTGASNRQRSQIETACQLLGLDPSNKHNGSIESVAQLIRTHCTSPTIQLMRFFHRLLFGWLTGNGSLHLKEWSLIRNGSITELSPAYGLINDRIFAQSAPESTLSIDGRHQDFSRSDLLEYLAKDVCELGDRAIKRITQQFKAVQWEQRILDSKLSKTAQRAYFELLDERWRVLQNR